MPGIIDDILQGLGLKGRQEYKAPEDRLLDLKTQAEEAEKLAQQTREAWEYKQRINKANHERQKVLAEAGSGKKGMGRGQMIGLAVGAIIIIFLFARSCIH